MVKVKKSFITEKEFEKRAALEKEKASEADAPPEPAMPEIKYPDPKNLPTQIIGSLSLFFGSLSSMHGIEDHSIQSHLIAFCISLAIALALGLSPGAKQLLEKWTFKKPEAKVNYKTAIVGLLLVLIPLYGTMGLIGPSGAWTVLNLAVSVTCFA